MDTDVELVQRVRRGELDAYGELVERHRDVVHRVVARIAGAQEADDFTQDAFLRAFHKLSSLRGDAPFRAWLLRVAHNTALNAERADRMAFQMDVGGPVGSLAQAAVPSEERSWGWRSRSGWAPARSPATAARGATSAPPTGRPAGAGGGCREDGATLRVPHHLFLRDVVETPS